MALLAAGSLSNVYQSLDRYVTEQLVTGASLSVKLHGVRRFVPPTDDPWIEVQYTFLGLQQQYMRQIYEGTFGTLRQGHIQLDIFQRARDFMQRYTLASARDTVVAAFPEAYLVPVFNYTDTLPDMEPVQVGVVELGAITEQQLDMGLESSVVHYMIQVGTRYLEHFTRT